MTDTDGQEISRQRMRVTGLQLVDRGGDSEPHVTLTLQDAPRPAREQAATRSRSGRMTGPAMAHDPANMGTGQSYTRTVPLDDENPIRVGEIMTIVTIRGDDTPDEEETE